MKQRGGPIATAVIPNVKLDTLWQHVVSKVERGSTVSTDELRPTTY